MVRGLALLARFRCAFSPQRLSCSTGWRRFNLMNSWWRNACLKAGVKLAGHKEQTKSEAKAALREAVHNAKMLKAKAKDMVKKVLKKK